MQRRSKVDLGNFISITIFIVLLYLPVFQGTFNIIPIKQINETRQKANKPNSYSLLKLFTKSRYSKEYEMYFNDNFGFRDLYIRIKNQMDYSLFNESSQAYLGEYPWLEDIDVIESQQVALDNMSNGQMDKIIKRMLDFSEILNKNGITLIIMPIPIKNTIYPEYFRNGRIIRPKPNGFIRFQNKMLSNSKFKIINVYKLFMQNKFDYPLYYKTDLHWNEIGAFLVSKEMVNEIAKLSGSNVVWKDSLEIYRKKFTGTTGEAMGLFNSISEKAPFQRKPQKACGGVDFPSMTVANVEAPFSMYYEHNSKCSKPLLSQTVLIGNSFMLYFYNNGTLSYFDRFYTLHDFTHFSDVLQNIPRGTKYIVWEFFEIQIPYQLQNKEWWNQLEGGLLFRDITGYIN